MDDATPIAAAADDSSSAATVANGDDDECKQAERVVPPNGFGLSDRGFTHNEYLLAERAFTLHFISIYRHLPTLWKIKSKDYMNKTKRSLAMKQFTTLLKMYRRDITEEDVKKKINIIRTSFKREFNKIKKSRLSGASSEEIYTPSLWYYKDVEFLEEQVGLDEEPANASTTPMTEQELQQMQPSVSLSITTPKRTRKKQRENMENELMTLAKEHFQTPADEYDIMARNWGFKLRRMDEGQRRLAERFINEILFEGEEGTLHRNSVIMNNYA